MALKTKYLCPLLALMMSTAAQSALVAMEDEELTNISGASGIEITADIDLGSSQTITIGLGEGSLDPTSPDAFDNGVLVFSDSNINYRLEQPLTIDVVGNTALGRGVLRLGLPGEVTFEDFNTGSLFVSLDSDVPVGLPPEPTPAALQTPSTTQFQLVATSRRSPTELDNIPNDARTCVLACFPANDTVLADSQYRLTLQDISRNSAGNLAGSGNLRILNFDDPNGGNTFIEQRNTDGSATIGGNLQTPGDLGGGLALGVNQAHFISGYSHDSGTYIRVNQGLGVFQNAALTQTSVGAFGSSITNGSRDTRILFSVDKETDLRFRMAAITCGPFNCAPSNADLIQCGITGGGCEPELTGVLNPPALDSTIVLLDANGFVLDIDVSSGGVNGDCGGGLIGAGDDCGTNDNANVFTTQALIETTLGTPFITQVSDRRIGGSVIGAPPEQNLNAQGAFGAGAPIARFNEINSRGSIRFNGAINVFGAP